MSVVEQTIREMERLLAADDGRQRKIMQRILDRLKSLPQDRDFIDVRLPVDDGRQS